MRQFTPLITQNKITSHHHLHPPQHSAQKTQQCAQKCRFCAREARKRGFRRAKAHKNLDFVLEMPENKGSKGQKSTKMPILCSKSPKMVSVSAITCHQYKESRVSGPAILSSICLGGDLGMLRSLNREAKRLFC